MVDWGAVVADVVVYGLAAVGAIAMTELAVRRRWAHRVELREVDGWMGRSTRDPGERDRPGINAGALFVLLFVLLLLVGVFVVDALGAG